MTDRWRRIPTVQHGATAVEFALVAMVLVTLLFGFIQFGIVMHTFNSAAQATRSAARVAVVSAPYSSAIVTEMQYFLPGLTADNVVICYPQITDPPGEYVMVRLAGDNEPKNDAACSSYHAATSPYKVIPWFFWPIEQLAVPSFPTWLPRESLGG